MVPWTPLLSKCGRQPSRTHGDKTRGLPDTESRGRYCASTRAGQHQQIDGSHGPCTSLQLQTQRARPACGRSQQLSRPDAASGVPASRGSHQGPHMWQGHDAALPHPCGPGRQWAQGQGLGCVQLFPALNPYNNHTRHFKPILQKTRSRLRGILLDETRIHAQK